MIMPKVGRLNLPQRFLRLRFLLLTLSLFSASLGVAIVSSFTPQKTPAYSPYYAEPGYISQEKIDSLKLLALSEPVCSAEGCTLRVQQSTGAMHSFLGFPYRPEADRDIYPIAGASDGVMTAPSVVVSYRLDPDRNYEPTAYQIWVPTHKHEAPTQ